MVSNCGPVLQQLSDAIVTIFFPVLLDGDISYLEAALFFLLARMGGLGIRDPVELCDVDFTPSQAGATVISDVVRGSAEFH